MMGKSQSVTVCWGSFFCKALLPRKSQMLKSKSGVQAEGGYFTDLKYAFCSHSWVAITLLQRCHSLCII